MFTRERHTRTEVSRGLKQGPTRPVQPIVYEDMDGPSF